MFLQPFHNVFDLHFCIAPAEHEGDVHPDGKGSEFIVLNGAITKTNDLLGGLNPLEEVPNIIYLSA